VTQSQILRPDDVRGEGKIVKGRVPELKIRGVDGSAVYEKKRLQQMRKIRPGNCRPIDLQKSIQKKTRRVEDPNDWGREKNKQGPRLSDWQQDTNMGLARFAQRLMLDQEKSNVGG